MGSAREAIEKKGSFKAYEENNEAYVELRGKIKSAKAQLATLDESAIGEAGTSRKSKKTQEAAAANDQVAPALQAEIEAELSSAQEAAVEAKNRAELAANDMFQLYENLLSVDAKYAWNKIVLSRPHQTHIQTSKAVLRKDPGDFRASRLTIA